MKKLSCLIIFSAFLAGCYATPTTTTQRTTTYETPVVRNTTYVAPATTSESYNKRSVTQTTVTESY